MPSLTRTGLRTIIVVAAVVAIAACLATLLALVTLPERQVQPKSSVLVGAGDIAKCLSSADNATAELLDDIPGTVFTAGDNVYSRASHSSPSAAGPRGDATKAHQALHPATTSTSTRRMPPTTSTTSVRRRVRHPGATIHTDRGDWHTWWRSTATASK